MILNLATKIDYIYNVKVKVMVKDRVKVRMILNFATKIDYIYNSKTLVTRATA